MSAENPKEEVQVLVQRVLKEGPFAMRQLAERSGLSYAALRAWASGQRIPQPESLEKLAGGLEQQAGQLVVLAGEVRRAAVAAAAEGDGE